MRPKNCSVVLADRRAEGEKDLVADEQQPGAHSTVEIQSDGVDGCGGHAFNPSAHNNRAGLLLVGNKVFLAFGATIGEDNTTDFHGFIIGVDVTDPAHLRLLPHVFCTTPTMDGGGIWMGGGGPASDGSSIYALTGDGAYTFNGDIVNPQTSILDAPTAGNYPESFVKVRASNLAVEAGYTDTRKFPAPPYVFDNVDLTPVGGKTHRSISGPASDRMRISGPRGCCSWAIALLVVARTAGSTSSTPAR